MARRSNFFGDRHGFTPSAKDGQKLVEKARSATLRATRGAGEATAWKRQSWVLPRAQARAKAREFLSKYPPAAYWTEVESWRVLPDDRIEFTMRRLPSAD